jgi:DNA-binding beta-propeller fold protein YncE
MNKIFSKLIIAAFPFLILLNSCGGSLEPEWKKPESRIPGLYLLNEGFMGSSNSSELMVVDTGGEVWNNYYLNLAGEYLGDVPNALARNGNIMYIVVTNSHVIRVIDLSAPKKIADIELPGKYPREMLIVDEALAYVSCSDGTVAKINLTDNTFADSYSVGSKPEGIAVSGDNLFVACSGWGNDNRIFVLDVVTGEQKKILYAENNVVSLAVKGEKLYAGAIGGWGALSDRPKLMVYDTETLTAVDSLEVEKSAVQLQIYGDKLYLNNGNIVAVPLDNLHSPEQLISSDGVDIIYGFLVDGTGALWLAKYSASNYASPGKLEEYDNAGTLIRSFRSGVGPRAMLYVDE